MIELLNSLNMKKYAATRLKSRFNKIGWIIVAWMFVSVLQFYFGYNILRQFNCVPQDQPVANYLATNVFTSLMAGVLGGSMIVFLWEKWLRSMTYGKMLLCMIGSYSVVYVIVAFWGALLTHYFETDLPVVHRNVAGAVIDHLRQEEELPSSYLFWLLVVLATLIVLQVNDKYGPSVFRDFLLGRYFHPRREERIFMFLDMRSSTAIAEQLGEEKYFNLVQDAFSDATAPIIYSKGEIYQYVGDEIIISWKMKHGLPRANCLNCFFEIQKTLRRKAPEYQKKYGLIPEFKAGVHAGYVMAGEIGVVKRDIAFSGDVLNTTARIQSKCNDLGVNLLFSKVLLERLIPPPNGFTTRKIGDLPLRGKQDTVTLYTLS